MRYKGTILIGILFIFLGAYVYFYEILGEPARRRAAEEKNRIYRFEPDHVSKITLTRSDSVFEFIRDNDSWSIVRPVSYKADKNAVDSLIFALKRTDFIEAVTEGPDRDEEFGLGTGAIRLTVESDSAAAYTVTAGDLNPAEEYMYARTPETEGVSLLTGQLYKQVNNSLYTFRNKAVFYFDKNNINEITFFHENVHFTVRKNEQQQWVVTQPLTDDADQSYLDRMLDKISNGRIQAFIEDDIVNLHDYGLESPRYRFEMRESPEDDNVLSLSIGGAAGDNVYIGGNTNDVVYELDSVTVNMMRPDLFTVRAKKISDFNKNLINNVELNYRDARYVISKQESSGRWYIMYPSYLNADEQQVAAIINDIFWIRAAAFVDDMSNNINDYGLDRPQADIILRSSNKEIERVQLGKSTGDRVYYYSLTKNRLYEIRSYYIDRLVLSREKLVDKEE
ncbi:DUF4340 domain-containing protein [candidate division KSB1 bacterium]